MTGVRAPHGLDTPFSSPHDKHPDGSAIFKNVSAGDMGKDRTSSA